MNERYGKEHLVEHEQEIGIKEAAELLDRKPHTLREWERLGVLPKELRPHRSARGWRWWTLSQIEGIKKWLEDTDRRPGKALRGARPSREQVEQHIHNMRRGKEKDKAAA